ncbi:MAG: FkbM family methyltransferase [Pseudomonadota bacterium]
MMEFSGKLRHLLGLSKAIGPVGALNIWSRRALRRPGAVAVHACGHAIRIRPTDSDPFVASQIFGWKDYQLEKGLLRGLLALVTRQLAAGMRPLIIDAGANVGYSAVYFASMFPDAQVIAIEPDPDTFAELCLNCSGHPRIRPVQAALWSHEDGVDLRGTPDAGSWSRQVSEGGGNTASRRLSSLIAEVPSGIPLIVKLDIEGAEREVMQADRAIIAAAPCIIIEPHDFMIPGGACLTPLFAALAGREMDTLVVGENLVFFDSALVREAAPAPVTPRQAVSAET